MSQKRTDKLRKRFLPLFASCFFQGFVFWYAIEKLFMITIRFNAQTIAIETVIFTVIMIVTDVPFGILADRWSRKGVLMLASLALITTCIICGFSDGFWTYTLGIAFWGIFYSSYNGTYDSIVYDVLLEEKESESKFEHYYGRIQLFDGIALVLGALLSTFVTHFYGLRAAYFLTIPIVCLSLVSLYLFKEPTIHKKTATLLVKTHIKETFLSIVNNGQTLLWIALGLMLVSIEIRMLSEFDQLWLVSLALPLALYGPVNAFLLSSMSFSGFMASKLKDSRFIVLAVGIIVVFSSLSLLTKNLSLVIVSDFILYAGLISLNIILSRYLHNGIASNVRAGSSSVVSTLGYILFLPIAIIFGTISKKATIFHGAWVIIGVAISLFICLSVVLILRGRASGAQPKEKTISLNTNYEL